MKRMKRILALVLAFMMAVSVAPATMYAADAEEPHEHEYTYVETILKQATHDATGIKRLDGTCKCGGTTTEYETIPIAHNYVDKLIEATCTTPDRLVEYCTVPGCKNPEGGIVWEGNNPLGHKYDKGKVTKAATCTEDGVKTYTCSECKADVEGHTYTEVIPKLSASGDHSYGEGTHVEADCTHAAGTQYKCTNKGCEDDYFVADEGSEPLAHQYDEGKETKPATCKEEGVKTFTCTRCGDTKTEPIPVDAINGHKAGDKVEEIKAADCANNSAGIKKYTCTICGETVYELIPVSEAHKWDAGKPSKEATCKEKGEIKQTCTICKEEKTEPFGPIAHTPESVVEENCETGVYAGTKCSECGDWLDGPVKVSEGTGAHNWPSKPKETKTATCKEMGYELYECTVCKATEKRNETPLADHKWEKKEKEPTCKEEGYRYEQCTVCGEKKDEETFKPDTTKHGKSELVGGKPIRDAVCAKEPADETKGIEKRKCLDCGKEFYKLVDPVHKLGKSKEKKAPTCTEKGVKESECTVCKKIVTEEIPAKGHKPEAHVEEASCTANLTYGEWCPECKTWDPDNKGQKFEVEGSKLGHDWGKGEVQEADCTHPKQVVYKCSRCTEVKTDVLPLEAGGEAQKPHDWYHDIVKGTCKKPGSDTLKCSMCGKVQSVEPLPTEPTNHENEKMVGDPLREAKCAKDAKDAQTGIAKFKCSDCGKTYYKTYTLEHTKDRLVETDRKEPTCGKNGAGKVSYKCVADCGYTTSEVIPALDHRKEAIIQKEVPADCENNFVYGTYCEDCGEWVERNELPDTATGHKLEFVRYEEPTCTTWGTDVSKCTICSVEVRTELKGVSGQEPTGHKNAEWRYVSGKEPTCVDDGFKELYCKECKNVIGDPVKITKEDAKELGLHKAEKTETVKAASCASVGIKKTSCSACSYLKYETIEKLSHKYGEPVVGKDGKINRTCKKCGHVDSVTDCGDGKHVMTGIPEKAPTCLEDGYEGGVQCSVCHKILVPQTPLEKGDQYHNIVTDAAVAPTCTEAGKTEGAHCSICGEVFEEQEEVPATGHTEEVVPGKEATCTEAGLTEGKKCSVCNTVLVEQKEIPAAHTPEKVAGKEATCTEAGLTDGEKCSVCGETLKAQEEIPAAGHTEVDVEEVPATCTTPGTTAGKKCSVCGTVIEGCEAIPTTGTHTVVVDPAVAATCTEAGKTEGSHCEVCGEVIVAQEEIPAAGHTAVVDAAVEATCGTAGLTEGSHCEVCGEVIAAQEEIPATGEHNYTVSYSYNEDYTVLTITYTCPDCGETKVEMRSY